ncbi:MAG: hypothetical protein AAB558_01595 [Patescibacteria group bacterium]
MSDGEQKAFGLGYWIFTHKRQVHVGQVGGLGLVCLIIWGIVGVHSVRYLTNRSVDRVVQQSFLATDILFYSIATPQSLRVLSVQVVKHDDTHVDVVALMRNDNAVFASHEVEGQFTVDGVKQAPVSFFVNVNETFYLPQLSILSTASDPSVTFTVLNIDWFRVHGEPLQERWEVSDLAYTSLAFSEDQVDLTRQVKWTLTNKSAYGFRNAVVTVVLLQDTAVVGVGSTVTDRFASLEAKNYSFTWSESLPLSAEPQVQVHVDRTDSNQILSPDTD